ncbi:THUMP-like domain-containing protein [Luteococcus peritonei]|uniref:SAM-dependent methyltransferase n=1 Tax=Luteococcus peritonei TaxID=88874 RepID=A0ABW4RWW4_9ACTN
MSLHDEAGARALELAMAEADPSSLAAATRLRAHVAPDLAAEALGQAVLRRRARTKFGERAEQLFFTADALEQATRPAVAAWRARRLVAEGITHVVDLGCGIGTDAMACAEAGLQVSAVELDPTTAEHARANLAAAGVPPEAVLTGDAVALAPGLLAGAGPTTCVFVDPARRTTSGRTWRVEAFTPPWEFVMDLLSDAHSTVVKLGPGVPRNLLPEDVEVLWTSDRGDVVEATIWATPKAGRGRGAVLLPEDVRVDADPSAPALPVAPVGRYLLEPDGAVIRAGALEQVQPGAWLLDAQVAYLSSDQPYQGRLATCFEVLDELDLNPKLLKAWVREHRVGTLEIKKRALDVDPAELRRKLQPKGPNSATLVLARTPAGSRALVCRRC